MVLGYINGDGREKTGSEMTNGHEEPCICAGIGGPI